MITPPADETPPSDASLDERLRALHKPVRDDFEGQVFADGTRARMFGPAVERGRQFGRYLILDRVGSGGMGTVYSAHDRELDRKVALKFLHATPTQSHALRERLVREAKALARLAHPNIVTVYEAGEIDGRIYVAMEWVPGSTLRTWMTESRTVKEILDVLLQSGRGLAAAHEAGIVHRDFKPDNVLVGDDRRVRVVDFGLARATGECRTGMSTVLDWTTPHRGVQNLTTTGTIVGTPAYMSPEQFAGRVLDARSDQFSYCVALWEAIFGTRPFRGTSIAELAAFVTSATPPSPPSARVSRRTNEALLRGLSRDPGSRFPSMSNLLDAIEREQRPSYSDYQSSYLIGLVAAILAFAFMIFAPLYNTEEPDLTFAFYFAGIAFAICAFIGILFCYFLDRPIWPRLRVRNAIVRTHINPAWLLAILFAGGVTVSLSDQLRLAVIWFAAPFSLALCQLQSDRSTTKRPFYRAIVVMLVGVSTASVFVLVDELVLNEFWPNSIPYLQGFIFFLLAVFGANLSWAHECRRYCVAPDALNRKLLIIRKLALPVALAVIAIRSPNSCAASFGVRASKEHVSSSGVLESDCMCDGCISLDLGWSRNNTASLNVWLPDGADALAAQVDSTTEGVRFNGSDSIYLDSPDGRFYHPHGSVRVRVSRPTGDYHDGHPLCIFAQAVHLPRADDGTIVVSDSRIIAEVIWTHVGRGLWRASVSGRASDSVHRVTVWQTAPPARAFMHFQSVVAPYTALVSDQPNKYRNVEARASTAFEVANGSWEGTIEMATYKTTAPVGETFEALVVLRSESSLADYLVQAESLAALPTGP